MAGVEGEDEFKDALAAADPPPSSPKPTTSKSKPDTGGGGGLGRRLLASIPLPATLSAAIGRFPSPKPPASNVGLGLLLDAGLVPAAAEPPASDAVSGGNGLHLPPLVALQRQHGEDRVAGRGSGVGEEEVGLVPAEERWPTAEGPEKDRVSVGGAGVGEEELGPLPAEERWPTAEGREKEGLAVDGCSTNRNCLPLRDQEEEGEQFPGDELAASVAQDQEVVVEQQGATEDCAAVVENDSNYSAVECAGDETKAGKDSNAVEVNETVMNPECAVGILDAAKDGVSVRLQECDDAVVAEQGVDAISVQDHHEVVEQCTGDQLTTITDGNAAQDQEVVEQEGATESYTSLDAVEQCTNDGSKAVNDGNTVEEEERGVEQEGAVGVLDAAKDVAPVELQEDGLVLPEQNDKLVEQSIDDQLRTATDDNAAQDHELVGQDGVTEWHPALEAVEQCTDDEPKAVNDGNIVEEEEKGVEQECAVGVLDAAKDVAPVELQEDGLVLPEQNDKLVEQSIDGQLRTATDDNAAQDHELVGQDGVTEWHPALEAVEQCTDDEPKAVNDGNIVEEEEKGVEQEGAVGILDAAKDVTPVESQEQDHVVAEQNEDDISLHDQHKVVEQSTGDQLRTATDDEFENDAQDQEEVELGGDLVVAEQGEDGISVQDQHKVVEQCTSGQLRTTMDNAAEGQRVVEQEGAIVDSCATTYNTVVGDQEKEMKQSDCDEPRASGDENSVEVKDKVVDQEDVVDKHGVIKDVNGVELLENNAVAVEQGGDGIEGDRVELYTSDQLRATLDDHGAKNQKVVEQEGDIVKRVVTTDGIAVEDQEKEVQQSAGDESKSTMDENGVEDNEKVDPEDVNRQGVVSDGSGVEAQEEDVLVAEQGGDAIFAQVDVNVLEQCTNDQLRTNMKDNAAEFLELVEQEGAIPEKGVPSGVITVEGQDKQVEQSSGDESRVTDGENAVKDNKKVDREDTIDGQVTAKDGSGVESQEENVVVPDQGMDGISLLNEGNVVAQCTSVQLITTADNNAAVDPEPVEQEGVISMLVAAKTGIAAESREDIVVAEQVEDSVLVQDKDEAVEQHTSDQLRTITDDNAMEDQELRREKIGLSAGYPQRPGKLNCRFYLSTGSCAYGSSCHFNHPRLKAKVEGSSFPSEQRNLEVEFLELNRVGLPIRELKAKVEGSSFPSEQRNLEVEFLELNRVGLPIREGARKCTYYMRNGTCKYGKKCCYNHPEQVLDVQLHTPTGWDDTNLQSLPLSKKSPEHETMDDISHESEILPPNILRMLLPPQNVPPCTEENEVRAKKDPDWASASDNSDGCCSADSSDGPLCKQEHGDYPERPECPFLWRFGNCKFASSCQYYHPKDKFPSIYHPEDKFPNRYHPKEKSSRYHPKKDPALSGELMVYPDKPGEPECPFYVKTGFCKFGANCKFHHPKDITPTMQGPGSPKSSVAANEHHPAATTTLKDHLYQQQKYPERPGRPDCRYYMQFGRCKFQSACIFNHPKDLVSSVWHPAECPFYMKTGTCQFGSACEFHHPKDRSSSRGGDDGTGYEHDFSTKSQNVLQKQEQAIYPERPGALECSHYMKHGYCKFQMNCKFHHPRDPFSTEIGSRTISVQP